MNQNNDTMAKLSHEIRTPLNSIIGLNRLISDNPTDSRIVEDCSKKIAVASDFLLTLVNNLLDIEQFSTGVASLDSVDFSLKQVISSITAIYEESANESNVVFSVNCIDCPDSFKGDKNRIQRVLANLISNGIKYNKVGGHVDLIIENFGIVKDECKLRFTVSDDGIGIADEQIKTLFEPKDSPESDEKDVLKGIGLGIPVANAILKQMNSKLNISSVYGVGTTAWFELTLQLTEAKEETAPQEKNDLKGTCILVADDNSINCTIVSHVLESFGCKVEFTDNGEDVIALFTSSEPHHYDAILLDIRMPGMDGLETCKRIRALGESAYLIEALEIPIIAMTANVLDQDKEKSFQAGMNAHLSKPVDPDELYSVLVSQIRFN